MVSLVYPRRPLVLITVHPDRRGHTVGGRREARTREHASGTRSQMADAPRRAASASSDRPRLAARRLTDVDRQRHARREGFALQRDLITRDRGDVVRGDARREMEQDGALRRSGAAVRVRGWQRWRAVGLGGAGGIGPPG